MKMDHQTLIEMEQAAPSLGVPYPDGNVRPTQEQMRSYPHTCMQFFEAHDRMRQEELNQSITREADLRDALAHAVAAMEAAQNISVMMAREENDAYGRKPSHMAIQNVLQLSLHHIESTTGINARGEA